MSHELPRSSVVGRRYCTCRLRARLRLPDGSVAASASLAFLACLDGEVDRRALEAVALA
jgi:hypothetical protein